MIAGDVERLLDRLVELLSAERAALGERIEPLCRLRQAVLARDEPAVTRLLATLGAALEQPAAEGEIRSALAALAPALGLDHPPRLAELAQRLGGPRRQEIMGLRREIQAAAAALRRLHLELAVILGELARANRLMLENLLGAGQEVTTYSAGGADQWRGGSGIVDGRY